MKSYGIMTITLIIALAFPSCKKETAWKPGMPLPKEKIKIAVILPHAIDSYSFYNYAHYAGTLEMEQNVGLADTQIVRKVNVFEGDPVVAEEVMRDCIAEGANIIIATSIGYMDVCEKLAAEFPSVIFAQSMGYKYNAPNFTNYTIRLYEAQYLSGIAAGMQTQSGLIGYVAAMGCDNSEVTGGINAFAIGVREVNPEARVYVRITCSWFDPMGETDAANTLIAAGCDVIAAHCDTPSSQTAAQRAGVWAVGFNSDMSVHAPDAVITSVVPYWGALYTLLAESVINATFNPAPHFYGLKEGVVNVTDINEKLAAPEIEAAVEAARQRIIRGGFNVFDGILETNDGTIVGEAGKTLSDDIILSSINWYYRNVVIME